MSIIEQIWYLVKEVWHVITGRKKKYFGVQPSARYSYSQCGEDLIVQYIFGLREVHKPSYLDIGAHDPHYLSNTAILYNKGCRGINVEANPRLVEAFKKWRPEDITLNVGISHTAGEMDFYIMEEDTLSTFSKEVSDYLISVGKQLKEIKKIKLRTIKEVLDEYTRGIFPDFLSLDVEGFDFDIA